MAFDQMVMKLQLVWTCVEKRLSHSPLLSLTRSHRLLLFSVEFRLTLNLKVADCNVVGVFSRSSGYMVVRVLNGTVDVHA